MCGRVYNSSFVTLVFKDEENKHVTKWSRETIHINKSKWHDIGDKRFTDFISEYNIKILELSLKQVDIWSLLSRRPNRSFRHLVLRVVMPDFFIFYFGSLYCIRDLR